ncbi:MAG: DUF5681 domain-containing protein [Rhodospirillales bacterium]|jgi:hypothetical protein
MALKPTDGGQKPSSRTSKIGFCQPPEHSRFKAGQSGNPAGRPKGRRNIKTELFDELSEIVEVSEKGIKREVTKLRALVKSAVARAANGDVRMLALLLDKALEPTEPDHSSDPITDPSDQEILNRYNARILTKQHRDGGTNE